MCDALSVSQGWQFTKDGMIVDVATGKALMLKDRKIILEVCDLGHPTQQWALTPVQTAPWGESFMIRHPVSSKVLYFKHAGYEDGVTVQLWSRNDSGAQVWIFEDDGLVLYPRPGKCLNASWYKCEAGNEAM
jgi:hypothetical protein